MAEQRTTTPRRITAKERAQQEAQAAAQQMEQYHTHLQELQRHFLAVFKREHVDALVAGLLRRTPEKSVKPIRGPARGMRELVASWSTSPP